MNSALTGSLWQRLRPEGSSVYVNFLEVAIKWKYDPQNMFRFNQSIPPQPWSGASRRPEGIGPPAGRLPGAMLMIIQNRDGSLAGEPGRSQLLSTTQQGYSAVVAADVLDSETSIIDELIGLAFDRLGARHLEVRVHPKAGTRALVEAG